MLNMDIDKISTILKERGYDARSAKLVASDSMSLSSPLNDYFESWLNSTTDLHDYAYAGYSVYKLMNDRNMTYPAAILTMDWLIKEPEKAIISLRKGIK